MSVALRCACGTRFEVTAEFDPAAVYVCDDCEMGILQDQARAFGGDAEAFRCEVCRAGLIGWAGGAHLCDECEDALHAEALDEDRARSAAGEGR